MAEQFSNCSVNSKNSAVAIRAKQLYELLQITKAAHTALSDQIDDDADSCEDEQDHPLHIHSSNAYRVLKAVENLIIKELHNDNDGTLRSEFEKLATYSVLKNGQNPIKHILKITRLKPPEP